MADKHETRRHAEQCQGPPTLSGGGFVEERERIDARAFRIDRRDNARRRAGGTVVHPEGQIDGALEQASVRTGHDPHGRPGRIGGMGAQHHGQRAGIDLRSLPYCFLALDRRASATPPTGFSRVIGRVEHFKPYARLLNCDATGLAMLELPKRADPALFKQLERTKAPLVYRWRRDGNKILGGETLG